MDSSTAADSRPDFLVRLGIMLPCTAADVEAAYRERVKHAHPDAGGTTEEFVQVQADYEKAKEFARFQSSRRGWLAASIERYIEQETVIDEIRAVGGVVEVESIEWMQREIGADFAQVLDKVVGVGLAGPGVNIDHIEYLVQHAEALGSLRKLDLTGAHIGRSSMELLAAFPLLEELNLSGTFVSNSSVGILARMTNLRRVELGHTFVGWWGRFRLRSARPDLEVLASSDPSHPGAQSKRGYRIVARLALLYLAMMLFATHVPVPNVRLPEFHWFGTDKLIHFSIYGGLTLLLAMVLSLRDMHRRQRLFGLHPLGFLLVIAIVATLGALDERTQPYTGRTCDIADWIADMAGCFAGLAIFALGHMLARVMRNSKAAAAHKALA